MVGVAERLRRGHVCSEAIEKLSGGFFVRGLSDHAIAGIGGDIPVTYRHYVRIVCHFLSAMDSNRTKHRWCGVTTIPPTGWPSSIRHPSSVHRAHPFVLHADSGRRVVICHHRCPFPCCRRVFYLLFRSSFFCVFAVPPLSLLLLPYSPSLRSAGRRIYPALFPQ